MHVPSRHPSTRPFMAAPRTQFYHPAAQIDAALKSVERCIRRGEGVALVVGPPGTGKSLLLAKVADDVRDDFDVALLSGASICTRRALWQAVLAAIGEPFRGIDEAELRISLVERIRGLAATGSGLVILVDEATTLPTRLVEELRLLTNVPTPLPAVHLVLAGTVRLEEMLTAPRMESLAQRVAVRAYLEPLDHAETMAYLRTQTRAAGLSWDSLFAAGCDDAVFTATDGVPRLINQLCDQALVLVAECDRQVTPADIATAWREIQRLPAPLGLEPHRPGGFDPCDAPPAAPAFAMADLGDDAMPMIEFGVGEDDSPMVQTLPPPDGPAAGRTETAAGDLWSGPDVELTMGGEHDPFAGLFHPAPSPTEPPTSRRGDFRDRPHVQSREGHSLGRLLASLPAAAPTPPAAPELPTAPAAESADDDADMVVIVDDADDAEPVAGRVTPVRPGDYRSLFTRLRRGDRR
ncbi:MAG: ExeA family protein [Planctomycetaceae bacterium]